MANMSSSTGSAPSPPQPVLDPPDVCRMIAKSADITSCKFRQLNSDGIGVRRRLTTAAGQLAVGHRSGLQLADPSDQRLTAEGRRLLSTPGAGMRRREFREFTGELPNFYSLPHAPHNVNKVGDIVNGVQGNC